MVGERMHTLGKFAPFNYGKGLGEQYRNPNGQVPVYGSNGIVGYHDAPLTNGPTVIIGRKGTIGAVHYSRVPCWPIDTTFFVSDPDSAVIRFKYYLLKSLGLEHMNSDSAVPGLNREAAHARKIHIPNEGVQRAIAHILGTLDDKIELNHQLNRTLEAIGQAIFKHWFVDFEFPNEKGEPYKSSHGVMVNTPLGEIPKGWRVSTIRELANNIQYGLTQSASTESVGPQFLRITDIQGGRVDWGSVPYCQVSSEEHQRYCLKSNDVLVARTGASTGENVYLADVPDAVFASYLVRFQFSYPSIARLVGAFMRTVDYFDFVAGCIGGSAQPNASAQVLAGAQLVVPITEIAENFFELVVPLDKRITFNDKESRTLANIRDSVLPKLLSGKIRVNLPEKEMAGK